jgi:hypothetical protein
MITEEFEDTKGVIIIRKSKDRQHNGQKRKNKSTNNDLQNITHKNKRSNDTNSTKNRKGKQFCSTSGIRRVNLVTNPVTSHK